MRPRKREKPGCNGPRTWDVQSTLEHAHAAHSTVRAAEWLVAGSPLPQALIQFCQRLTNEPRLCTLIILLRQHLSLADVADIRVGQMAVTVTFRDGMELQLLPAVQRGDQTAVSAQSGDDWSHVRPKDFAESLSRLNEQQGRAVVHDLLCDPARRPADPRHERLANS